MATAEKISVDSRAKSTVASRQRRPSESNSPPGHTFQNDPEKRVVKPPKKYTLTSPGEDRKKGTTRISTPVPPPNPQVYVLPTENVKLVFPDDDETVMAANLRALDDKLGRPSDLHAIILESGEDVDTFSRALHSFQERNYNAKKVTEAQQAPATYQQEELNLYQRNGPQTRPSSRHKLRNSQKHLMAVPHVYHQQQALVQGSPYLLQQNPHQNLVYRPLVETRRGYRRRRSVVSFETSSSRYLIPVSRKARSPDDESSENGRKEQKKQGSEESEDDESMESREEIKDRLAKKPVMTSAKMTAKLSQADENSASRKQTTPTANFSTTAPAKITNDAPPAISSTTQPLSEKTKTNSNIANTTKEPNSTASVPTQDSSPSQTSATARPEADGGFVLPTFVPDNLQDYLDGFNDISKSTESPDSSEKSSESADSSEKSTKSPNSSEKSSESPDSSEKSSESSDSSEMAPNSPESNEKSSESENGSGHPNSSEMRLKSSNPK
ncbi:immunoglobulin A1 protease autotransporter-like, partial [Hyalella azteca]|uniref:Immunoglobulin A1 protease autotransporter-like n=1 Tax=Hyalella azteca TaxID=294128 RepID=A0A8B7N8G3_HYAAZ